MQIDCAVGESLPAMETLIRRDLLEFGAGVMRQRAKHVHPEIAPLYRRVARELDAIGEEGNADVSENSWAVCERIADKFDIEAGCCASCHDSGRPDTGLLEIVVIDPNPDSYATVCTVCCHIKRKLAESGYIVRRVAHEYASSA